MNFYRFGLHGGVVTIIARDIHEARKLLARSLKDDGFAPSTQRHAYRAPLLSKGEATAEMISYMRRA